MSKTNSNGIGDAELNAWMEARHTMSMQWREPLPACGPEGNLLDAHVTLRATIHDCVNMQRLVAQSAGRPTVGNDGQHLFDFMASKWARVVVDDPADTSSHTEAIELFIDAYAKWNSRQEGGEDDLHYAARVARHVLSESSTEVTHNEQLPETP